MFVPALMLLLITLFDCRHKYVVIALFFVGLTMSSGVFSGGMLNPIEISPRHSGLIFATSNSVSAITGFLAPYVASLMTPNVSYYGQWVNWMQNAFFHKSSML